MEKCPEETAQKEPSISLYEYYQVRFGFKPPEEVTPVFKKMKISSTKGKMLKATIDNAVNLMESLNTQELDKPLVELITAYLSVEIHQKNRIFKNE